MRMIAVLLVASGLALVPTCDGLGQVFPTNPNDLRQAFGPMAPLDESTDLEAPVDPETGLALLDGTFPANFRFRANGNAILDTIYDTGSVDTSPRYFPTSIALDGTPDARGRGRFLMSGTTSRVVFDFEMRGELNSEAKAELDFVDGAVRLRNIFGIVDLGDTDAEILGGQYWTTFGDEAGRPVSIISDGTPAGAIFKRPAQLRYTRYFGCGISHSFAVENPTNSDFALIDPPVGMTPGDVRLQRWPDVVARVRVARDLGTAQLAVMVRGMGLENTTGLEQFATGWGVAGTTRLHVSGQANNLALGFVGGEGIGQSLFGLAGTMDIPQSAAGPDASGRLTAVENVGAYIGYQHFLSEGLQWNMAYGIAHADTGSILGNPNIPRETQNAWVNVIMAVRDDFFVGVEYHFGNLEVSNRNSGDNHRIQMTLSYIPKTTS